MSLSDFYTTITGKYEFGFLELADSTVLEQLSGSTAVLRHISRCGKVCLKQGVKLLHNVITALVDYHHDIVAVGDNAGIYVQRGTGAEPDLLLYDVHEQW